MLLRGVLLLANVRVAGNDDLHVRALPSHCHVLSGVCLPTLEALAENGMPRQGVGTAGDSEECPSRLRMTRQRM